MDILKVHPVVKELQSGGKKAFETEGLAKATFEEIAKHYGVEPRTDANICGFSRFIAIKKTIPVGQRSRGSKARGVAAMPVLIIERGRVLALKESMGNFAQSQRVAEMFGFSLNA